MKTLALLLFTALLASANLVTVELTGTSGVGDGTDEVLPYYPSINGGVPISADCYDFFDEVGVGQIWQASEMTLAQVLVSGQFAGGANALENYELAGIFSTFIAATQQQQIDLQHDLWNLFDPGRFVADAGMTSFLNTGIAELPAFNFSGVEYLEGVPGTKPVQAFVIYTDSSLKISDTPEPATMALMGFGLIGIAVCGRGKKE